MTPAPAPSPGRGRGRAPRRRRRARHGRAPRGSQADGGQLRAPPTVDLHPRGQRPPHRHHGARLDRGPCGSRCGPSRPRRRSAPPLLAWLLSIAMEPAVLWLSRRGMRRGVGDRADDGVDAARHSRARAALRPGLLLPALAARRSSCPAPSPPPRLGQQHVQHLVRHRPYSSALELTPDKIGELAGKYGGGILGVFGSVPTFLFDALTILVFAYYFFGRQPPAASDDRLVAAPALPARVHHGLDDLGREDRRLRRVQGAARDALRLLPRGLLLVHRRAVLAPLGVFAGIVGQFIPTIGTYIGSCCRRSSPSSTSRSTRCGSRSSRRSTAARELRLHTEDQPSHDGRAPGGRAGLRHRGCCPLRCDRRDHRHPRGGRAPRDPRHFRQRHELVPELASLQPPDDDEDEDDEDDDADTRTRAAGRRAAGRREAPPHGERTPGPR